MIRAVRSFRLAPATLAVLLDIDAARTNAILAGRRRLSPSSPAGLRAMQLVRLHRALGDVFGLADCVDQFLDVHHPDLGAPPRSLLLTEAGRRDLLAVLLVHVRDTLDPVPGQAVTA